MAIRGRKRGRRTPSFKPATSSRFHFGGHITCTGAAATVLTTPNLATAKPGFVDRLIHADTTRYAGELLTFETATGRLPGVRVLTEA